MVTTVAVCMFLGLLICRVLLVLVAAVVGFVTVGVAVLVSFETVTVVWLLG